MTHHRRAALAAFVLVALAVVAAPAAAHEGAGTLALESADATGALAVRYRVRLAYTADGHPVPDATVTAVATGPASTTPVPLTEVADGLYEGTVTFPSPGNWTVRFTSVTPPATLEHAQAIAAPTTTAPPTTTTTSDTAPAQRTATAQTDDDTGGDGDSDCALVVVAVVVALAVAGGATALTVRRRRSA